MELIISFKGNKYIVVDKSNGRQIYTIKKKSLGGIKYTLMDKSNYKLYSMAQYTMERKPTFVISHNDNSILQINCKSLFLDPTLTVSGRDIHGVTIKYEVASKDRRNFDIVNNGEKIGYIKTNLTASQELQYDVEIENKFFDDYVPLFALAIDLTFGEINKETGV